MFAFAILGAPMCVMYMVDGFGASISSSSVRNSIYKGGEAVHSLFLLQINITLTQRIAYSTEK